MDYDGLGLSDASIRELVIATGPQKQPKRIGFTFSDLRARLLPEALGLAFPDKKLTATVLLKGRTIVAAITSRRERVRGRSP